MAHPSARNQYFPRLQQFSDMPDTRCGHITGCLKLAASGIVQLGRAVEILVAAHAAGDENLAIRQQGCAVPGPGLKHGRCGNDRPYLRNCGNSRSKGHHSDSKTGYCQGNEKRVEPAHVVLLGQHLLINYDGLCIDSLANSAQEPTSPVALTQLAFPARGIPISRRLPDLTSPSKEPSPLRRSRSA